MSHIWAFYAGMAFMCWLKLLHVGRREALARGMVWGLRQRTVFGALMALATLAMFGVGAIPVSATLLFWPF